MDLIRPIFFGRKFEWELQLTPEEVERQLRELRETTGWWERPLQGRFSRHGFMVARPMGLQDNAKVLTGTIEPSSTGGSKVRARFRLSTTAFIGALVLLLVSYITPLICVFIAARTQTYKDVLFAVFSLSFPVLGTLAMHAISWLNQWNEKIIAESVANKLEPFVKKGQPVVPNELKVPGLFCRTHRGIMDRSRDVRRRRKLRFG